MPDPRAFRPEQVAARWLDAHEAAAHVGLTLDAFRRRVKAGTLPAPSDRLGARQLRWHSAALDAAMAPAAPSRRPLTGAIHALQAQAAKAAPPALRR